MKRNRSLKERIIVLAAFLAPIAAVVIPVVAFRAITTHRYELLHSVSPDGVFSAVARAKKRTTFPIPGPEPPRTKAIYHTLRISRGPSVVIVTKPEDLGKTYSPAHLVDALWTKDSRRLAYRLINDLVIFEPHLETARRFSPVSSPSYVSSFRWMDTESLVILTKDVPHPLAFKYPSYIEDATGADLWALDAATGETEHLQRFDFAPEVTYLFRSAAFKMDELSPFGPHVALSDGAGVIVYDYEQRQVVCRFDVDGDVEGVWWADADTCILAIETLSGTANFLRLTISDGVATDVTDELGPRWRPNYDDFDWFRTP